MGRGGVQIQPLVMKNDHTKFHSGLDRRFKIMQFFDNLECFSTEN